MPKVDVFNLKREKVGSSSSRTMYSAPRSKSSSSTRSSKPSSPRGVRELRPPRREQPSAAPPEDLPPKGHGARASRLDSGPGVRRRWSGPSPKPRDWSYRPPRQMRIGALKSALSLFVKEGRLLVVEKIDLTEIETKLLAGVFDKLQIARKALVVDTRATRTEALDPQHGRSPVPAARGSQRLRPPPARPSGRQQGRGQGPRSPLPQVTRIPCLRPRPSFVVPSSSRRSRISSAR